MIARGDFDSRHGRVAVVEVSEPGPEAWAQLHPDERALGQAMAERRREEWVAGRRALRRALASVVGPAAAAAPIASDDRGAPRVAAGMVGSISHKRSLAVALAARDTGWTVGIDLELDEPRRVDIAHKVLTPLELAALAAEDTAGRDRALLRAFTLKEAIYKAIDPHLRRYVGFLEVEVWPEPDGGAVVAPVTDWGLAVEAAWYGDGRHLVATARARRR